MTSSDTALLIIDVQNAFFIKDYNVYVYNGNEILLRIKNLITKAREEGIPVIFVQHQGEKGSPWEPGTPGHLIHPDIAPLKEELIIHKPTPDAFYRTKLKEELDNRGVRRLVIAGIQSDWCVDTTVRRAYSLEYDVTVVEDAHTTFDTAILKASQIISHHNSIFGGRFAKLVKTDEIDFKNL